jgi:hypothetical protein
MELEWNKYETEYDYLNGEGAYREYIGYYPMEFSEDEEEEISSDEDNYEYDYDE